MRLFYLYIFLLLLVKISHAQDLNLIEKTKQDSKEAIKDQKRFENLFDLDTLSNLVKKQVILDTLQKYSLINPELRQQMEVLDDTSFVEVISKLPVSEVLPVEHQQYLQQFNKIVNDSSYNIKKQVTDKAKAAGEQQLMTQASEAGIGVEVVNKISIGKDSLNLEDELGIIAEDQALKIKGIEHLPPQERSLNTFQKDLAESNKIEKVDLKEGMPDVEQVQSEMERKMQHLALDHFEDQADKIQSAVDKLKKHKERHFLEGSKGSSKTQNTPIKKRIYIGGTFQLAQSSPIELDVSPLFGYRITKNWSLGVGGTFRSAFEKNDDFMPTAEGAWGYRIFLERKIISTWLIHGEFESISQKQPLNNDLLKRKWNSAVIAGLGKEISISSKLRCQVLFLYNFSDNAQKVYQSPFIFRLGLLR